MEDIIYFELNNWACGKDYPDEEPFLTWMDDDSDVVFNEDNWFKENRLCVVRSVVDMSLNYCVTASKAWVQENCPSLLTKFQRFLRTPDENGEVFGMWRHKFLPYRAENFGVVDRAWGWDDGDEG